MIITAILKKKYREETGKSEWALVSKSNGRVLKWFGGKKPSSENVLKEERRVQWFKHKGKDMDKNLLAEKVIARLKQSDFINFLKNIPEVGDIVTKTEIPEKDGYPCKIHFKSGKSVWFSFDKK